MKTNDLSTVFVEKFENTCVSRHMFIVTYEDSKRHIQNYFGTLDRFMKDNPTTNVSQVYVFNGNHTPTHQDFYDIFGEYPTTALGWSGPNVFEFRKTENITLKPEEKEPSLDACRQIELLKWIYSTSQILSRDILSFLNELNYFAILAMGGTRGMPGGCSNLQTFKGSIRFQINLCITDMSSIAQLLLNIKVIDKLNSDEPLSKKLTNIYEKARNLKNDLICLTSKRECFVECKSLECKSNDYFIIVGYILHHLSSAKKLCSEIEASKSSEEHCGEKKQFADELYSSEKCIL